MDWIALKETGSSWVKRYKYLLLVLITGIFFMCIPSGKEPDAPLQSIEEPSPQDLQDSLSEILSNLYGAGKVKVLLSCAQGEKTMYQTDIDITADKKRQDTVLITESDRTESGLIQQINPPVYMGAIILCQGAENAEVKLNIVQAVMSVTGLTSDHITVLKMK